MEQRMMHLCSVDLLIVFDRKIKVTCSFSVKIDYKRLGSCCTFCFGSRYLNCNLIHIPYTLMILNTYWFSQHNFYQCEMFSQIDLFQLKSIFSIKYSISLCQLIYNSLPQSINSKSFTTMICLLICLLTMKSKVLRFCFMW